MSTKWLEWAKEIQALAQAGLHYSSDVYDLERFERMREISFSMIEDLSQFSYDEVKELFSTESGYQTPKIDTRAVVWQADKILLVQENDGLWSLPGGWMDITETVASNTEKELFEEAGVTGNAKRIIGLQDRNRNNIGTYIFTVVKIFVECDLESMNFQPNSETLDAQFFDVNNLPTLSLEKTTTEQIMLCSRAHRDPHFMAEFD